MTSTRPYLIRALYEWMLDNGLTPHLLVNAGAEQVEVPQRCIENDKIILNIAPDAIRDLEIGNEYLGFTARFNGKPEQVLVPVSAVQAVYARENGEGMVFPEEDSVQEPAVDDGSTVNKPAERKKPSLSIVK